jgi:hypothetical protein
LPWLNTFDPYLATAVRHAWRDDLGIRTGTGVLAKRPDVFETGRDCTGLSSTYAPPEG